MFDFWRYYHEATPRKERGQAHLPDHEPTLIDSRLLIERLSPGVIERLSSGKNNQSTTNSSQGGKRGLPPLPLLRGYVK
jgi:hypothetical protein